MERRSWYLAEDGVLLIKRVEIGVEGEVELRCVHILSSTFRHATAHPHTDHSWCCLRDRPSLPPYITASAYAPHTGTGREKILTCHRNKAPL